MRIAVFGLGYVGATTACCLTRQGHHVLGVDVSEAKVRQLNQGIAPIAEPGVQALLLEARRAGLIDVATTIGTGLDDVDVALVCVGTPSAADGSHNMGHIAEVSRQIAAGIGQNRARPLTVAYRSTVRPGTMEKLVGPIFRGVLGPDCESLVEIVYNPEFLRESSAIADYFNPPKIVIGTRNGGGSANMDLLHAGIDAPKFYVNYGEAEFTKLVDNSWHALKVGYANEIGRICQQLGISAAQVHEIFVSDTKLNISSHYLRPGGAFGGSCLPKDVRALQHISADVGAQTHLLEALTRTNEAHKRFQFEKITQRLKPEARVLLVGLAFKANTDDLRESPNVDLARRLLEAGYRLSIYDSGVDASKLIGQNLGYAYSHLPGIESILVDKATAESTPYDLAVASNAVIGELCLAVPILDISAIP